ncbi:MAG TPA: hypothetical protein VGM67_00175 [Gemmatimonadaceae bacterium]|jgi:hypothetical protein
MSSASSVAAALAVIPTRDDAPRVIQQFTSIFLVNRYGELWRIYDSSAPEGADRKMPSSGSTLPHRLFVALARKTEVRVHLFAAGAAHDTDPVSLQAQLDDSVRV